MPPFERDWIPEIVVDVPLARELIEAQFPDLCPATITPLGSGWDNTVFRVNERFVFRFPRREIAVELVRTELQCLPVLGPRLPVPIPMPVYRGEPSGAYQWPFAGYRYIPGRIAPSLPIDMAQRHELAMAMARFLKALHEVPAHALPSDSIPFDTLARLDLEQRRSKTEHRLALIAGSGMAVDRGAVLRIFETSPPPPTPPGLVVVHGDLHAGQLLVGDRGDLLGVIDWGDLHLGHAAVDLALAHQLIPATLHDAFLAVYGSVDPLVWQLAKGRAASVAVALLAHAVDVGDRSMASEARMALAFVTGGSAP
jgi:aminoglycoside phosphotransferase (APT) family kinase protein